MKLGLFGGSFDPIHFGHLIQARDALERLGLERLLFIPAAQSPHKLHTRAAPASSRLAMVKAAVAGQPGFEVCELEIFQQGPSYAVDTVRRLGELHPGSELFYLVGEDNLAQLSTWREYEELTRRVQFVVLSRGRGETSGFPVGSVREVAISSTEIRQRVAEGRSIQYLVPEKVRDIIIGLRLYKEHHL